MRYSKRNGFAFSVENVVDLFLGLALFCEQLDKEFFIDQTPAERGLAIELFGCAGINNDYFLLSWL